MTEASTDDDWDTEDYSATESALLPVKLFQRNGLWYWCVDHPALNEPWTSIGPFPSAKLAYQSMMQYDKLWAQPFDSIDQVNLINEVG